MTALIVVNSIAAAIVVLGLAVAMRLGHLTAGLGFERTLRHLELHCSERVAADVPERRAA